MLTVRIRAIIVVLLIISLVCVIRSIVKKRLDVKYALPWFFMFLALAILDAFPSLLKILTNFVGISSPVNMLFFFGFCFSLIIIFFLTSTIYSLSNRLRNVAQDLALLRNEIKNQELEK